MYIHSKCTFIFTFMCMQYVYTSSLINIFVYTWYRHVYTASRPHFTSHQAQSALQCRRVSAPRRLLSFRAASFLSSVFSTDRTPRRGLPRPNCHSIAATLAIRCCSVTGARREDRPLVTWVLCWLYLWGMVGVELPARNLAVQLVKTSMCLDCFGMYKASTLHVHVHSVYIHVHTLYMGTTYYIHIPLWYIPLLSRLYCPCNRDVL
jgi:hypothetical protein